MCSGEDSGAVWDFERALGVVSVDDRISQDDESARDNVRRRSGAPRGPTRETQIQGDIRSNTREVSNRTLECRSGCRTSRPVDTGTPRNACVRASYVAPGGERKFPRTARVRGRTATGELRRAVSPRVKPMRARQARARALPFVIDAPSRRDGRRTEGKSLPQRTTLAVKAHRFLSASDSCRLRRGREGRRPAETGPSGYVLEGPSC